MTQPGLHRARSVLSLLVTAGAVSALAVGAGAVAARAFAPTLHSRYFPWITGRALGVASYFALTGLVLLGTWMRHPWRFAVPALHGETRLRTHAALGVATIVLVAGHLVSLAADRYAGVGWWGALVPGMSHYRTLPVALGVVAFLALVAIGATAGLAGARGTRHWLAVHRASVATFAAVWVHGLFAGTDARTLRVVYVVTGLAVVAVVATRHAARPAARRVLADHPAVPADHCATSTGAARGASVDTARGARDDNGRGALVDATREALGDTRREVLAETARDARAGRAATR
ncbi:MAG TPA: hypothetical protein VMV02_04785 [Acidimicrobiales bacterium]|nr:hypothetical protein [Acidimicrobiales bacterium]